jgi:hypothetical protein
LLLYSDFSSMLSPPAAQSAQHLIPPQQEVPMAVRSRILCIGDHLETTAEELRGAGFEVMLVPNAHAARALVRLYPPVAILGDHEEIRAIHQKHPQIPAVLMPVDSGGKIPPHSATHKVNEVLGKLKAAG